ncbi:hypothetical protein BGZ65_000356, partial [Modicella reniformis]
MNAWDLKSWNSVRFPNLKSLIVDTWCDYSGLEEFMSEHPSSSLHIVIRSWYRSDPQLLWSELLMLNNLKRLDFRPLEFDNTDSTSSIGRLERPSYLGASLKGLNQSSTKFSRIKELTIPYPKAEEVLMLLEVLKRCPHLTTLICESSVCGNDSRVFIHGFARLLSEGIWPDFKAITLDMEYHHLE